MSFSTFLPFLMLFLLNPETGTASDGYHYISIPLFYEDEVDGVIKPTLTSMNYCGNDSLALKIDLSPWIEKDSPWFGYYRYTLFGRRDQFGPAYSCPAGTSDRRNFKLINQLLNEAKFKESNSDKEGGHFVVSKNGEIQSRSTLFAHLRIRKEPLSPSGLAVRLELHSKRFNKTFLFFDSLSATYEQ